MDQRRFVRAVRDALLQSRVDLSRPIVVAVSGGADSMALLESLRELSEKGALEVVAAHFNHRLRGADSDGDERFVVDWCAARSIRCVTGRASQSHPSLMSAGESPEAAARAARYAFLARVQADAGASAVVTGHTRDDQAETVLLHLVRGSGLAGIRGMRDVTELQAAPDQAAGRDRATQTVTVVRPLLKLRRFDTEAFCRARGITPRHDVTNDDLSIPRNRIRHLVLPQLELINSAARNTITRFASAAGDDLDLIESLAEDAWAAIRSTNRIKSGARRPREESEVVSRSKFLKLHPAVGRRVLMHMYASARGRTETDQGLEHDHLDAMFALAGGRPGTSLDLPNGYRMEVGYRTIEIRSGESSAAADRECPFPARVPPTSLEVPGKADLGDGFVIRAQLTSTKRPRRASRWTAYVDHAVLSGGGTTARGPLEVRARKPGDRFTPGGMHGEKKLQDFFVDEKVPRQWRDRVPLVVTRRGIAWVVGYRLAEWAQAENDGGAVRLSVRPVR